MPRHKSAKAASRPTNAARLLAGHNFRRSLFSVGQRLAYSTRLLSHFLLHCHSGLKVAALARLLGVSRPTASRQQGMSSKQAVQQAHHRMDGRPYGKLLARFAGPIIEFRLTHPRATRADLIAFINDTFGVRVSRIALYHFLKKFGLGRSPRHLGSRPPPVPNAPAVPGRCTGPNRRLPGPEHATPGR